MRLLRFAARKLVSKKMYYVYANNFRLLAKNTAKEQERDRATKRKGDRKIVSSQTRALKFARHFNFHFPWPAKQFFKPPQKAFSPGG